MMTIPSSTAEVERDFSALNNLKTDKQTKLSAAKLRQIMTIKLSGPIEPEDFSSKDIFDLYCSKKERRSFEQMDDMEDNHAANEENLEGAEEDPVNDLEDAMPACLLVDDDLAEVDEANESQP